MQFQEIEFFYDMTLHPKKCVCVPQNTYLHFDVISIKGMLTAQRAQSWEQHQTVVYIKKPRCEKML